MPRPEPTRPSAIGGRLRRLGSRASLYAVVVAALGASANLVAFLDRNREDITEPGRIVAWAAVAALGAATLVIVVVLALPRVEPPVVGVVVGSAAFGLFCWSWFDAGPLAVQYASWIGGTAAIGTAGALVVRAPNGRLFVLVLLIGLVTLPAVSFVRWDQTERALAAPLPSPSTTPLVVPVRDDLPNVYVFVLDGYGRADQLLRVTGHDNRAFEGELATRGFAVDPRAFTPYPVTWLAIASLFDMDHVASSPTDVAAGRSRYIDRLRGNNAFVRELRRLGYGYVHAESGTYDGTRCTDFADACISARTDDSGLALDELEFASLQLTPLRPLLDRGTLPLADTATTPDHIVGALPAARVVIGADRPFVLFAHIVSPHAPYRYEASCRHRLRNVSGIGVGWDPGLRDEYVDQLRCLNTQLLGALDRIVARDPDAIIVLTGDHGPAFTVDFTAPLPAWSDDQRAERFAVFHALRVPEGCAPTAGSGSIVDSLRVVRSCIDGPPITPVEPRAFLFRYEHDTLEELDDLAPLTE